MPTKPRSLTLALLSAALLAGSFYAPQRAFAGPEEFRKAVEVKKELPFLSPALGSHMVLRHDAPNTFWGWTQPGAAVALELDGKRISEGVAGADGRWELVFQGPPAGGPYTIRLLGPETRVLEDVLSGEVWLCGGQSNMNWPLKNTDGGEEAVKNAANPHLRLVRLSSQVRYSPSAVAKVEWKVSNPEIAAEASAVAFRFGDALQKKLGMPVGIVQSALGGSPIESWMRAESLASFEPYKAPLDKIAALSKADSPALGSFLMHWLAQNDAGLDQWNALEMDTKDWVETKADNLFATTGIAEKMGIGWFRCEVELPAELPAGPHRLKLGVVDKMDTSYVNGRWIGASSWVENPRNYEIPAGVLKPGRNVIAIRIAKLRAKGGFMTPENLSLHLGDSLEIPLAKASWKGRLSFVATGPEQGPLDLENYPTMPTVLQNGMIAPLAPLAVSGMLWYQGEANTSQAWRYRSLLPSLIADWRELFRTDASCPFLVIGLPAFMQRKTNPGEDGWAELRDAQAWAANTVPGTYLVTTIDTGDANNIHPRDKALVSERAARIALSKAYKQELICEGPTLRSVSRQGGELRLRFDHVEGGLNLKAEASRSFAIAGADQKWVWAKARIEGDCLLLSAPSVAEPLVARYAWASNPEATLYNGAGLPAAPFRTDTWKLSTQ